MATSPEPRSCSRNSFYSTTTYHSFQDIELDDSERQSDKDAIASVKTPRASSQRQTSKPRPRPRPRPRHSQADSIDTRPASFQMIRQDSGYESSSPGPRSSTSVRRRKRSSQHTSSPSLSQTDRSSMRPALRRRSAGGSISHISGRSSLTLARPSYATIHQQHQQHILSRNHSYFQFPSPEHVDSQDCSSSTRPSIDLAPVIRKVNSANAHLDGDFDDRRPGSNSSWQQHQHQQQQHLHSPQIQDNHLSHNDSDENSNAISSPHMPPQTTHYWTSDSTRRLEYAAIDAASRGVRGWIMRNVVPECLIPKGTRRVCFDDDSGSVRRYRLDLETDCPEESDSSSCVREKLKGSRARGGGSRSGWLAKLKKSSS